MPRGGKREGAGRPVSAGEVRKLRSMRATNKEWQLIQKFARMLKKGDRITAENFIREYSFE